MRGCPGFARLDDLAHKVDNIDHASKVQVVADDLSGCKHEVVAQGGVNVCEVLGGISILASQ